MDHHDLTDIGGSREAFLTTHWSLIGDVNRGADNERALIDSLLRCYWKPVYCFLRYKGFQNEEAKDLTQAFFHDVVLNRDLVARANPSQGRFRTFLLHALDQYLIDCRRKENAKKRIPPSKLVSLELIDPPVLSQFPAHGKPEDYFNYVWKSSILDQALSTTRQGCYEQGLQTHWHIFEERILQPIFDGRNAPSMKDVCERHAIENESTASNMLVTVKRRFRAVLRGNLRQTVLTEADVDGELKEMLSFLTHRAQEGS